LGLVVVIVFSPYEGSAASSRRESVTHPKIPPCALIMARPDGVELGEIGRAAIAGHDAAKAAVVGLAHGRVHADLGGDAADDQRVDVAVAQELVRSVAKNAPLPGLSTTGSPSIGASAATMS
jgi:hypothetical protein